ncbi:uncharacterized protein LOC110645979 isoform X2 [Hevea brasiliensis]|uniref:uncharacterized protein LOC110645979 isoform X2 n=1 Tax=Hevea brasiliensis TaxID=3981 RepID=UPI0025D2A285|nr:uncharacterized protein LOC110645979 isoform X2 [Hevea brasiliensis]
MAGVLNIPQSSFFRSIPSSRKAPRASISIIRATSETPLSSTSTSTTTNKEAEKLEASFTAPPNFKPLEPKPFTVKEGKILYILGASLALFFRLGTGVFVSGYSVSFVSENEIPPNQYALEVAGYKVKETSKVGPRREKPIEIYDLESCPFCRKVREIVAVLDIDVLFYPCPKNGPTFRPKVVQMGGKQQFRYMVDPNTGTAMYESDDIIKYLVGKYVALVAVQNDSCYIRKLDTFRYHIWKIQILGSRCLKVLTLWNSKGNVCSTYAASFQGYTHKYMKLIYTEALKIPSSK